MEWYKQFGYRKELIFATMIEYAGIEALLLWKLLFSGEEGLLSEPAASEYAGVLEGMEATELLSVVREASRRLLEIGMKQEEIATAIGQRQDYIGYRKESSERRHGEYECRSEKGLSERSPVELFIDKQYRVHLDGQEGRELPLRPLVRALFILFLKHPEGILLKDRGRFQEELEDIYEVIAPHVDAADRHRRVRRLTDFKENAFSENLSVLNATLDRIMPPVQARNFKVQGNNGFLRRIPLSPLKVHWQ